MYRWQKTKLNATVNNLTDKERKLFHQLRSGKCMDVRDLAAQVADGVDARCPDCLVTQTVRHMFLECKNAGVAHWRRIAWPNGVNERNLFSEPEKVMMVWRKIPERLRWRELP